MLTRGITSSFSTPHSLVGALLCQYLIVGVPSSDKRRSSFFFEFFRSLWGFWGDGHLTLDLRVLWVQVLLKRQREYQVCPDVGAS